MAKPVSTALQIVLIAVALAVAVALVAYLGFPAYFDLLQQLFPQMQESDSFWSWIDWGYLLLTLLMVLPLAAVGGVWLSRRIVVPLLEVARAIRAIAAGDLTARANPRIHGFGESARLVADFNAMAERLERAEAELRYSNSAAAHELRTPLTILKGRLQGIADGVFTLDDDLVGLLIAQVDGMTRIVEDLRTLGLFNAGTLELTVTDTDLAPIARDVIDLSAEALHARSMAVHLDLRSAPVSADPARLRQVILALLDNAMRYAPGKPLSITTGVDDGNAVLTVTDNGPGLSAIALRSAFEPFWRDEDSRARDKGGSGLGLSVVRAIVHAHDGRVRSDNAPGHGACFTVILPARA
tara:strand:- start:8923 stop:9984 length:1062 start_codon:yes stop_codon:yes gene_type:complete